MFSQRYSLSLYLPNTIISIEENDPDCQYRLLPRMRRLQKGNDDLYDPAYTNAARIEQRTSAV